MTTTMLKNRARADQLRAEARTCREQANHWDALGHVPKAYSLNRRASHLDYKADQLEAKGIRT
jgi:hypothetical protein